MNKYLISTIAALAMATPAAATISMSGEGAFGALYNSTVNDTFLFKEMDIKIDAEAKTDRLTFGATQHIYSKGYMTGRVSAPYFYAKTGNLTVGAGNITGAIDSMPGLYMPTASQGVGLDDFGMSLVTNTSAGRENWDAHEKFGYGAFDGVELEYTHGAWKVHASSSREYDAIAVAWSGQDWTLAAGQQQGKKWGFSNYITDGDKTVVTATRALDDGYVTTAWADNDGARKWSLKAGKMVAANTNVYGFVADEYTAGNGEAYGVGVSHDLGGASFEAGIAHNNRWDQTLATAGVHYSF